MARPKARGAVAPRRHGPDEEAARLGVSATLILEACRDGRYPHERLGRRILIDPAKADEYLARTGITVEEAVARTLEVGR